MSLAELARLLNVDPKWVLNTLTVLRRPKRYSLELARRLAVMRAISEAAGVPIARAFTLAERALDAYHGETLLVTVLTDSEDVALTIDVPRILSSFNVRLSVLRSSFAPRQRGRRAARRRDPLKAAAEWGIDLTLLADNRLKSPEERLRQLDAMAAFARDVRRAVD